MELNPKYLLNAQIHFDYYSNECSLAACLPAWLSLSLSLSLSKNFERFEFVKHLLSFSEMNVFSGKITLVKHNYSENGSSADIHKFPRITLNNNK